MENLIRNKIAAGRMKDLADVDNLKHLSETDELN